MFMIFWILLIVLNVNGEEFDIPLVGLFNAYNALGAIALAKELGIKNIQENPLELHRKAVSLQN